MSLAATLDHGITTLGLNIAQPVQQKLLDYLALLAKWNKVHNLTAVRDAEDMVTLHLLDSLAILPHITGNRLLDVGSGAGLPGIPIALARPEVQVTVLDSSHKKTTFLRQAKAELGLDNLQVICSRVEQYQPAEKFQLIVSRAFSDLAEFVKLTSNLVAEHGVWLAMKGVHPYDEIAQLDSMQTEVLPLQVPGLDAQRHLVVLKKAVAS
jgi:16S rRNA (guanine527-N7)-methyltransferase